MTTDDIVRIRSPRRDCASDAAFVREAVFATRGTRLYAAVASSRGRRHAVNEDGHSTLDGTAPLFVVADGVSSGAMASRASGDLVAHLHASLGHGRADAGAVKRAVLDADREIARSIARRTGRDPRLDPRLHAPIGLKLGDKTPGEIAISILAEILLLKSDGELAHSRLPARDALLKRA